MKKYINKLFLLGSLVFLGSSCENDAELTTLKSVPFPSEINAVIAVAGGEVCHGWHNKKMGGEWAGGYKASYKQNKLAVTSSSLINKIEIRYYLCYNFIMFSFCML